MINFLKRKTVINVKGRNIKRFIRKLNINEIELLKLDYVENDEVNILIYKDDLEKIENIKSIYEIEDTENYGVGKLKKIIKLSKFLLLSFLTGFILFIGLINMIFDIEVIHSDKDLRKLITNELSKEGIKVYRFKKSYDEIEKIKNKIIKKYPDKIEWMEIKNEGIKYVVRVEERKINKNNENKEPRNLVAKKNGVVKKIINYQGESLVENNTFVKKGEPIISGEINLNDETKGKVRAMGKVYAEVWYKVKTTYPYTNYKKIETGNTKNVVVVNFFSQNIEFSLSKFRYKKIKEKKLLKSNLLPINLAYQKQKEIKLIDEVLTFDEALLKAEEYSISQMKSKLNEKEYIIRSKSLKSKLKDSKIELEMFFAIYEDITDYVEIGD